MFRSGAFLLVLILGCKKPEDDCQRAMARLARIDKAKGYPANDKATEWMLEACRTGKHASWDPVLRCAMDSKTDEAAAECIDRGIKEVLGSGGGEPGRGLNPLLK